MEIRQEGVSAKEDGWKEGELWPHGQATNDSSITVG